MRCRVLKNRNTDLYKIQKREKDIGWLDLDSMGDIIFKDFREFKTVKMYKSMDEVDKMLEIFTNKKLPDWEIIKEVDNDNNSHKIMLRSPKEENTFKPTYLDKEKYIFTCKTCGVISNNQVKETPGGHFICEKCGNLDVSVWKN